MKVLLVVPVDQAAGGVSCVAGNLALHLRKSGHDVFFLCPGDRLVLRSKVMANGFPGFEIRMQPPRTDRHPVLSLLGFWVLFPLIVYQLMRLIKSRGVDVVNVQYPLDNFLYFAVCRRVLRIVLVNSIHGADIFPQGRLEVTQPRGLGFLLSSSDLIIAPSRRFREDFLQSFPELKSKTAVIHNGIDVGELSPPSPVSARPASDPTVLCVSTYKPQKAIDVLVRAFALTLESVPSAKLVVVGGGPLRPELETLATTLGIRNRIRFLGVQERASVSRHLHDCDIFVLPSRFETFGIALLEAMASKKPVVATTAGGIPEIIEHGKNGLLVEPDNAPALAEALNRLLQDPPLRFALAAQAYATVNERFRSETMGETYETAFLELLEKRRESAARSARPDGKRQMKSVPISNASRPNK